MTSRAGGPRRFAGLPRRDPPALSALCRPGPGTGGPERLLGALRLAPRGRGRAGRGGARVPPVSPRRRRFRGGEDCSSSRSAWPPRSPPASRRGRRRHRRRRGGTYGDYADTAREVGRALLREARGASAAGLDARPAAHPRPAASGPPGRGGACPGPRGALGGGRGRRAARGLRGAAGADPGQPLVPPPRVGGTRSPAVPRWRRIGGHGDGHQPRCGRAPCRAGGHGGLPRRDLERLVRVDPRPGRGAPGPARAAAGRSRAEPSTRCGRGRSRWWTSTRLRTSWSPSDSNGRSPSSNRRPRIRSGSPAIGPASSRTSRSAPPWRPRLAGCRPRSPRGCPRRRGSASPASMPCASGRPPAWWEDGAAPSYATPPPPPGEARREPTLSSRRAGARSFQRLRHRIPAEGRPAVGDLLAALEAAAHDNSVVEYALEPWPHRTLKAGPR